MLQVGHLLYFN